MFDLHSHRVYKSTFEASHLIEGHPKCGIKHGHSYHLTIYTLEDLDKWHDFADIKIDVDGYVQKELDHHDLGNASAEEISRWIADYLGKKGYIGKLELFETEKFGVTRSIVSHK